jgi:PIN domain nuclease of toxin-antitoxin system
MVLVDTHILIWLENLRLDWSHRDPADRTIVATARIKSLALISKDEQIHKFPGIKCIW